MADAVFDCIDSTNVKVADVKAVHAWCGRASDNPNLHGGHSLQYAQNRARFVRA